MGTYPKNLENQLRKFSFQVSESMNITNRKEISQKKINNNNVSFSRAGGFSLQIERPLRVTVEGQILPQHNVNPEVNKSLFLSSLFLRMNILHRFLPWSAETHPLGTS